MIIEAGHFDLKKKSEKEKIRFIWFYSTVNVILCSQCLNL